MEFARRSTMFSPQLDFAGGIELFMIWVVSMAVLLAVGIVWLMRFPRTGRRSLRELFLLVAYWATVLGLLIGACRWWNSHS